MDIKIWYVYMLRCGDGSLYTGITDNVLKRLSAHRNGKGAKYTKGRGPLSLHYLERFDTKSDALRREAEIKKLSTARKRELISAEPIGEDQFF